ncbi:MAG TPA: SCO family protein [Chitinophagaceae bacterium]|nr:SCO family protein [Chitinophagaceae bacterium]
MKIVHRYIILFLSFFFLSFSFPDEKKYLGQKPVDIEVYDANGNKDLLSNYIKNKPLIISPIYTKCYSLCGLISGGLQTAINQLGTLGNDFNMLSFSFDSTDTKADLADYQLRWKMDGIHWKAISASGNNINVLMKSIGFEYDFVPSTNEYDHPSILVVLSPSGKITRFVYGINPSKNDIELAVLEAASERSRPGIVKGFYLRCFGFDPIKKTYRMDWRFIISTSAGLLMIVIVSSIFIKTFITSKQSDEYNTTNSNS